MTDPTADAYRLAADYLDRANQRGSAYTSLRNEADRLDERHEVADRIGQELMTKAAEGCGPLNLGILALGLVSSHYELKPLPLPLDELADPDPS